MAGIIIALLASLLIYPFMVEQSSAKKSDILSAQAQLLKSTFAIPDPAEMKPGVQNSQARFIAEETARQSENITRSAPDMSIDFWYRLLSYMTPRSPLSGIAGNQQAIEAIGNDVQNQISAYNQLIAALLLFIEYNPTVDTTDYQSESNETQQRMQRLADGLDSTVSQLRQLPESPAKDNALAYITSAKEAQSELASSGNTDEFVNTIEGLQGELVKDLSAQHQAVQQNVRIQLVSVAQMAN